MAAFVDLATVAVLAGVSRRALEIAANRIASATTTTWRGARLVVRTMKGRGGRAGIQYQVRIDSLPSYLQERLKAAETANPPAVIIDGDATVALWRDILYHLVAPIAEHPRNSIARGEALRRAAQKQVIDPETKTIRRLSERSLQRYAAEFERVGMAAFVRRKRKDAGKTRVFISVRWDAVATAAGLDDATKAAIADKLRTYVRSSHKNCTSTGNIQHRGAYHLMQFSCEHGFEPSRLVCAIPKRLVTGESIYSHVGQFRLDNKAFHDRLPAIRRSIEGMAPMQCVVGDVHSSDILLQDIDGYQRHAKLIAWMDVATRRVWVDVVILPKGKGVRNADVIASFRRMVAEWGMPSTLYLDNGSEYKWADYLTDAFKLIGSNSNNMRILLRAKAYGARAKPIEGGFAALNIMFRDIIGFIGGNRMKSKTANVGRAPTPFPGNHEAFARTLWAYVALYHDKQQYKTGTLGGLSPNQKYEAAIRDGWHKIEVHEHAFATAFCTRERRVNDRGVVRVDGRIWTCPELQAYIGSEVIVLIPKWEKWDRLPLEDAKGRLIGFAEEDRAFAFLDPAGARESTQRKHLRLVSVRETGKLVPDIDPHADVAAVVAFLPTPPPVAPIAGFLGASEKARAIGERVKETSVQKRKREANAAARQREFDSEITRRMALNSGNTHLLKLLDDEANR